MKLASELQKRSTGRTVYILDEPTTGLHFEDIRKLLTVINGLVDKGNTVIVIEHNLDVIKTSDWIIDMGPEGGSGGGTVVATGTPEDVAANTDSYTGPLPGRSTRRARGRSRRPATGARSAPSPRCSALAQRGRKPRADPHAVQPLRQLVGAGLQRLVARGVRRLRAAQLDPSVGILTANRRPPGRHPRRRAAIAVAIEHLAAVRRRDTSRGRTSPSS